MNHRIKIGDERSYLLVILMELIEKYSDRLSDYLFLAFRIIIGVMFASHGVTKLMNGVEGFATGMGLPLAIAYLVAIGEIAAGASVVLGLYAKIGSLVGIIIMIGALSLAHFSTSWNIFTNKGELALVYLGCFMLIFAIGTKRWSIK